MESFVQEAEDPRDIRFLTSLYKPVYIYNSTKNSFEFKSFTDIAKSQIHNVRSFYDLNDNKEVAVKIIEYESEKELEESVNYIENIKTRVKKYSSYSRKPAVCSHHLYKC